VATTEELLAIEEANADAHIHMPSPSYWPIVLAFALPIMAYGLIYNLVLMIVGAGILVLAMYGWALEPSTAPETDFDQQPPSGGSQLEVVSHG
jgi:cytochrome c oxidase subunit I